MGKTLSLRPNTRRTSTAYVAAPRCEVIAVYVCPSNTGWSNGRCKFPPSVCFPSVSCSDEQSRQIWHKVLRDALPFFCNLPTTSSRFHPSRYRKSKQRTHSLMGNLWRLTNSPDRLGIKSCEMPSVFLQSPNSFEPFPSVSIQKIESTRTFLDRESLASHDCFPGRVRFPPLQWCEAPPVRHDLQRRHSRTACHFHLYALSRPLQ